MNIEELNTKKRTSSKIMYYSTAIVAAASFFITIITVNNLDFNHWFTILSIFIVIILVILFILESEAGGKILTFFQFQKDKSTLKRNLVEYESLINNFNELKELTRLVDQMRWENSRPGCHLNPLNLINKHNVQIQSFPKWTKTISINLTVNSINDYFHQCLYVHDQQLRSGKNKFESEDQKKRIQTALRKYENFIDLHNKLCKKINANLKTVKLLEIYSYELHFDWNNA